MDAQSKIGALIDMGFPETHAKIAVERLKTASTEQLVEYLLANAELIERYLSQPRPPQQTPAPEHATPPPYPQQQQQQQQAPLPRAPVVPIQVGNSMVDPRTLPPAPTVPSGPQLQQSMSRPPTQVRPMMPARVMPQSSPMGSPHFGGVFPGIAPPVGVTPPQNPEWIAQQQHAPPASRSQMFPPPSTPPPPMSSPMVMQHPAFPPPSMPPPQQAPAPRQFTSFNPAYNLPGTQFTMGGHGGGAGGSGGTEDEPDYFRIPSNARNKNPNNPIIMKDPVGGGGVPNRGPRLSAEFQLQGAADFGRRSAEGDLNNAGAFPVVPPYQAPQQQQLMPPMQPQLAPHQMQQQQQQQQQPPPPQPSPASNVSVPQNAPAVINYNSTAAVMGQTRPQQASRPATQSPDAELFSKGKNEQ
jgi:hypothetical protein